MFVYSTDNDTFIEKLLLFIYLFYEFLSRIASSVLKVNCYQWGSCIGGPSAFNSPFGHRSRSHNICPLDNHLSETPLAKNFLTCFTLLYEIDYDGELLYWIEYLKHEQWIYNKGIWNKRS